VAFSPDGRLLATGGRDGAVRLWDVAARRMVTAPLRGHTADVTRVAFSPDGSTLASASFDRTVRLWSVSRRRLIGAPLRGYIAAINVLAFSPDGTNLVGSTGITARLWDSVLWIGDQRTQHARACAAGRRNLSRSEWTRLLPGEPYHETCRGA
jgi:WD40 repeat protein